MPAGTTASGVGVESSQPRARSPVLLLAKQTAVCHRGHSFRCAVHLNHNAQIPHNPANSLKSLNSYIMTAPGIKNMCCITKWRLWGAPHEVGRYTLALRPPCTTDNNKNNSAWWKLCSNDRRAQRVAEITPRPAFLIHLQLSTSLYQQTHYMEL